MDYDIEIVQRLPVYFGSDRGEPVPEDLIGATIIAFGTPKESKIEGGGLVIDFTPAGSNEVRRIVFGFNEIAMWVEK